MELEKKIRLPHGGRIVGSATDFLQLSPEEASLIELKLALATGVRELRERNGLTQTEVAAKLGSSQSRVAKMEAGDRSVFWTCWSNHYYASGPPQPQSPSRSAGPKRTAPQNADHQGSADFEISTSTLSANHQVVFLAGRQ